MDTFIMTRAFRCLYLDESFPVRLTPEICFFLFIIRKSLN